MASEIVSANISLFSEEEQAFVQHLIHLGQEHLFERWPPLGTEDEAKRKLVEQLKSLNEQYPGGLQSYTENARKLLEDSRAGVNPYEGFTPVVPSGERLEAGTPEFDQSESAGKDNIKDLCFVLVAGGLGERLGYQGIKVELPIEITTDRCFLGSYCESILAFQRYARISSGISDLILPFAIMTSDDTHASTVALLEANNDFGMASGQITIIKQEKVPAIMDNEGRFALKDDDPYEIQTKPHGHGDIHLLLHTSGLARKWQSEGRKWVLFFQDTNGLVFNAVPAALGVSVKHGFVVNSLTVPRRPGEAVGGICKLEKSDGSSITVNVEYNQLDPLLRSTGDGRGDAPDETGFSPYPGNINVLIFALEPYVAVLERTNGIIAEFVNPKYKDSTKTTFKSPTRLECMMQDFPKLLSASDPVGFTQLDRWISFSAVKNNIQDAIAKLESTGVAECASSGEADIYKANRKILGLLGAQVEEVSGEELYAGVRTETGAHIVWSKDFGITLEDIRAKFPNPGQVQISGSSTLVIIGSDITIESLNLDGALWIEAVEGARITVHDLSVKNEGWQFVALSEESNPKLAIRGYTLVKHGQVEHIIREPGEFSIE